MDREHFDFKELVSIYSALKELQSGRMGFQPRTVLAAELRKTWQTEPFESESRKEDSRIPNGGKRHQRHNLLSFIRRGPRESELLKEREQISKRLKRVIATKPSWLLAMSSEFVKAAQSIKPEPRRRILEAIESISKNPARAMGNTVGPLAGKLNGLWCYRVEGYNILYSPDIRNKRVAFLTITRR